MVNGPLVPSAARATVVAKGSGAKKFSAYPEIGSSCSKNRGRMESDTDIVISLPDFAHRCAALHLCSPLRHSATLPGAVLVSALRSSRLGRFILSVPLCLSGKFAF